MTTRRAFYVDLLERSLWTFVQSAAAAWLTPVDALQDLPASAKLAAAGTAGLLAVVKSLAAGNMGERHTAQALPGGGTYDHESA